jgi:hypothetical protein
MQNRLSVGHLASSRNCQWAGDARRAAWTIVLPTPDEGMLVRFPLGGCPLEGLTNAGSVFEVTYLLALAQRLIERLHPVLLPSAMPSSDVSRASPDSAGEVP